MSEATSETPILDLLQPLREYKNPSAMPWWQAVLLGIGIVIAATAVGAVGCFAIYIVDQPAGSLFDKPASETLRAIIGSFNPLAMPFGILALVAISFVVGGLHELGHLVAGKLVGFDVKMLCMGPLAVSFEAGSVHFALRKGEMAIGFADARIRSVRKLRRKLALYVAGGPLVSLLSVVVIIIIMQVDTFQGLPALLKVLILLLGIISGIDLVFNLWPFHLYRGLYMDGARLLTLATSRQKTRRWMSILAVDMQRMSGLRPKLWRRTWVQAAGDTTDPSCEAFYGCWQAYAWANDCDEAKRAAYYLEACLHNARIVPPSFRESLIAEAANFQAWFRHDHEKAQLWFDRLPKKSKLQPLVRIRASISLHWVHNRQAEALAAWNEGLKIINERPEPSRKRAVDSWNEWKQQLETRRAPSGETPSSQSANHDLA